MRRTLGQIGIAILLAGLGVIAVKVIRPPFRPVVAPPSACPHYLICEMDRNGRVTAFKVIRYAWDGKNWNEVEQ